MLFTLLIVVSRSPRSTSRLVLLLLRSPVVRLPLLRSPLPRLVLPLALARSPLPRFALVLALAVPRFALALPRFALCPPALTLVRAEPRDCAAPPPPLARAPPPPPPPPPARAPPPPPPPRAPPPPPPPPPRRCARAASPSTARPSSTRTTIRAMRFMKSSLTFLVGGRVDARDHDRLGRRRRVENERLVIERRRQVPGEDRGVIRPRVVIGGGDYQLTRQRVIPVLYPYLPVDSTLPERVVLDGRSIDFRLTEIDRGADTLGRSAIGAPEEEIAERHLDSELVLQRVCELTEIRRRGHRRVVS